MESTQTQLQNQQPRRGIVLFLAVYAVLLRLLPFVLSRFGFRLDGGLEIYPWNFTPIFAISLYAGALFRNPRLAVGFPIALTLLGDLAILAVTGRTDLVSLPITASVVLSLAVAALWGRSLRGTWTWTRLVGTGLGSCLFFFLVTNLVCWRAFGTYDPTLQGLGECYLAGVPYLRNTLLGTAVYCGVLFSPAGLKIEAPAPVADPSAV